MNGFVGVSWGVLVAGWVAACGAPPSPPPQAAQPATTANPPAATAAVATEPPAPGPGPAAAASAPPESAQQDGYATVHGLKMHYVRQGHGPVLVLLHPGMASVDFAWAAALPFFSRSFDVIAPEQMGHGKTADDDKRPLVVHAMAEDTVELLRQLDVTSAMFVGWSDGGNLALDIAMHHPALARKIATTGANFSPAGADPKGLAMLKGLKVADFPPEFRDWYAKNSPDGPEHLAHLLDRARKMWLTDPTWTTKDLAAIHAPALIMAGDHDSILTSHTVQLSQAIPGAQLAIFPNAGHDVVVADAARWNAVVLTFLEEPLPTKAK